MVVWVEKAGRAFLLAFAATLVIYMPGIWEAPNLTDATGLGIAAFVASLAAGLLAIKAILPEFSVGSLVGARLAAAWVARIDLFIATAVGSFIATVTDLLNESPDLSIGRAAIVAAMTGAVAAAFRAVVGAATKGETGFGIGEDKGIGPPME